MLKQEKSRLTEQGDTMHKTLSLFFTVILAFGLFSTTASALNPKDVDILLTTKNCDECDLSSANLNNKKLRGASLKKSNLAGAFLTRADLTGADLSGADLTDATLKIADLARANLNGANLDNAHFEGADLFQANLTNTNRDNTHFEGAYLVGTVLARHEELTPQGAAGSNAAAEPALPALAAEEKQPVTDKAFSDNEPLRVKGDAQPEQLTLAERRTATISSENVLPSAETEKIATDVQNIPAVTSIAKNDAPAPKIAEPEKNVPHEPVKQEMTDLEKLLKTNRCMECNLSRADLSGKNLKGAHLERANLAGANLYKATLEKANLKETDLAGANLEKTDLEDADLYKANLSGANCKEANFTNAALDGANLSGTDFTGAQMEGAVK